MGVAHKIMKRVTDYMRNWQGGYAALFLPSMFFIAVGIFTLFAPHLVVAALAAFFFFLGAFTCYIAWRLVQLRRKMELLMRNFEARIYIQRTSKVQRFDDFEAMADKRTDQKKIVVH